jgi:hypothetical protein
MKGERYTMLHGPAPQTSRRGVEPQGPGRATATTLDDEHHGRPRLLPIHSLRLPHFPRPLPECEGDPGAGPVMETDAEVEVNYWDSLT